MEEGMKVCIDGIKGGVRKGEESSVKNGRGKQCREVKEEIEGRKENDKWIRRWKLCISWYGIKANEGNILKDG